MLKSWFLSMASNYCLVSFNFTLSISCRAGLVVTNSLSFYLSRAVLISPLLLKTVLADKGLLVDSFLLLLALRTYDFTVFWPPKYLMRNLIIILKILCTHMWLFASLLLLSRFYLWLLKVSLLCVLVWVSLSSSYWVFIKPCRCSYSSLSSSLRYFQPLFLQIVPFLSSASGLLQHICGSAAWYSTGPLGLLIFQLFFSVSRP